MALPLLAFEGDSLTSPNNNIGATNGFAYQLVAQITNPAPGAFDTTNFGVSGSTTAQMAARSAAVDALADPARSWQVLTVWSGTNDLTNAGLTPAQTYTGLVNYCQARQAVGFKVLVFTITAHSFMPPLRAGPTFEADRQTLNANIRANWPTFADGLVDIGNDFWVGSAPSAYDHSLYQDGLHLWGRGQSFTARLVRVQLPALAPGIQIGDIPIL